MSYASQECTPLSSPKGQGPTGPRVVSGLHLDLVCRLPDCNFLASGVCPLVGEAGLEVCAGFLAGRVSACPQVGGAGCWPSGGQGHSRGMSRCSCGLRKSLGSLSAEGWGMCPHPASCLARGVPAPEPTGYWVGPSLGANDPNKMSAFRRVHADECSLIHPPPVSMFPGWATTASYLCRIPSKTRR